MRATHFHRVQENYSPATYNGNSWNNSNQDWGIVEEMPQLLLYDQPVIQYKIELNQSQIRVVRLKGRGQSESMCSIKPIL